MSGLDASTPIPTAIKLHQQSRVLEIAFSDGREFRLPYELLRVYSPSAEVRGHGPGQEVLQIGKREVTIKEVEPVGHYAIRPSFRWPRHRHLLVGLPVRLGRPAGRVVATLSRPDGGRGREPRGQVTQARP